MLGTHGRKLLISWKPGGVGGCRTSFPLQGHAPNNPTSFLTLHFLKSLPSPCSTVGWGPSLICEHEFGDYSLEALTHPSDITSLPCKPGDSLRSEEDTVTG